MVSDNASLNKISSSKPSPGASIAPTPAPFAALINLSLVSSPPPPLFPNSEALNEPPLLKTILELPLWVVSGCPVFDLSTTNKP